MAGILQFPRYSGADAFFGACSLLELNSKPAPGAASEDEMSIRTFGKGVARLVAMVALPILIGFATTYNLFMAGSKAMVGMVALYKGDTGIDERECLSQAAQHIACLVEDVCTAALCATVILPLLYAFVPKALENAYTQIHAEIVSTTIVLPQH